MEKSRKLWIIALILLALALAAPAFAQISWEPDEEEAAPIPGVETPRQISRGYDCGFWCIASAGKYISWNAVRRDASGGVGLVRVLVSFKEFLFFVLIIRAFFTMKGIKIIKDYLGIFAIICWIINLVMWGWIPIIRDSSLTGIKAMFEMSMDTFMASLPEWMFAAYLALSGIVRENPFKILSGKRECPNCGRPYSTFLGIGKCPNCRGGRGGKGGAGGHTELTIEQQEFAAIKQRISALRSHTVQLTRAYEQYHDLIQQGRASDAELLDQKITEEIKKVTGLNEAAAAETNHLIRKYGSKGRKVTGAIDEIKQKRVEGYGK